MIPANSRLSVGWKAQIKEWKLIREECFQHFGKSYSISEMNNMVLKMIYEMLIYVYNDLCKIIYKYRNKS